MLPLLLGFRFRLEILNRLGYGAAQLVGFLPDAGDAVALLLRGFERGFQLLAQLADAGDLLLGGQRGDGLARLLRREGLSWLGDPQSTGSSCAAFGLFGRTDFMGKARQAPAFTTPGGPSGAGSASRTRPARRYAVYAATRWNGHPSSPADPTQKPGVITSQNRPRRKSRL
jgi:hypothetical protein